VPKSFIRLVNKEHLITKLPHLIHLQRGLFYDSLDGEAHRAVLDEAVGGQEVGGVEVTAHEEIRQDF